MTTDIQLVQTSELIQELVKRCHDGCMIVCCYRDEIIPPQKGKDIIMANSAGFANNDEIMDIMVNTINNMILDYQHKRR